MKWLSRNRFLLLSILGSFIVIIFWVAANPYLIENVYLDVQGYGPPPSYPAPCELIGPLYDSDGYAHNRDETYSGPAPLFWIEQNSINVTNCDYPAFITPTIVLEKGQTYYPITMRIKFPNENIYPGESVSLSASVNIGDEFLGEGPLLENSIRWKFDENRSVKFSTQAPNIEFAPSNDEARSQILSLQNPVTEAWSIAPKERASGDQTAMIALIHSDNTGDSASMLIRRNIIIDVQSKYGIDAQVLWITIAIGVGIGWFIDRIKTILEIRDLQQSKRKTVSQKTNITKHSAPKKKSSRRARRKR